MAVRGSEAGLRRIVGITVLIGGSVPDVEVRWGWRGRRYRHDEVCQT